MAINFASSQNGGQKTKSWHCEMNSLHVISKQPTLQACCRRQHDLRACYYSTLTDWFFSMFFHMNMNFQTLCQNNWFRHTQFGSGPYTIWVLPLHHGRHWYGGTSLVCSNPGAATSLTGKPHETLTAEINCFPRSVLSSGHPIHLCW